MLGEGTHSLQYKTVPGGERFLFFSSGGMAWHGMGWDGAGLDGDGKVVRS